MENEGFHLNEKAKELIASATSEFLKTRLILSQMILQDSKKESMLLQDFIEEVEKLWKKDEEKKVINEYIAKHRENIIVNNQEIEELCLLVSESLSKYPIGDYSCFTGFPTLIEISLRNFRNNLANDDRYTYEEKEKRHFNIYKWNSISSDEKKYGIDPRVQGSFSWGEYADFTLHDVDGTLVAKIGMDGTNNMHHQQIDVEEVDYLLARNLFIGEDLLINSSNKEGLTEVFDVLLKKEENEHVYYKQIYHDTNNKIKRMNKRKDQVLLNGPINNFFDAHDLSFLKEDYYTVEELERALMVVNQSYHLTHEEKELIEEATNKATNYWTDIIALNVLENEWYDKRRPYLQEDYRISDEAEEKLENFKTYLKNEIRADLMANNESKIICNYEASHNLKKVVRKAEMALLPLYKLNQNHIDMNITLDEIKVVKKPKYQTEEEVMIYDLGSIKPNIKTKRMNIA